VNKELKALAMLFPQVFDVGLAILQNISTLRNA
jgi:hypothetical protein